MISSITQAIVDKLAELYPAHTFYVENIPQNFATPSFLVSLIEQDYIKRINVKYKGKLSFDVAYFSNKGTEEIKSDCLDKQLTLLRNFDLIGNFRALDKQAQTTDNVLHVTFNVNYSEINSTTYIKMQEQQTIIS